MPSFHQVSSDTHSGTSSVDSRLVLNETVTQPRLAVVEESQSDEPNLVLDPEEIATLSSLMHRYDKLLVEMDTLNERLEELLQAESPAQPKP
jgi:hypothetical protein